MRNGASNFVPPWPTGTVTGVGSLPLTGAAEAVDFVREVTPEMPFWPQLPRRAPHEGMFRQFLGAGSETLEARDQLLGYAVRAGEGGHLRTWLERGTAELNPLHAGGFFAFMEALAENGFPDAVAIKGQLTGPLIMSAMIFEDDRSAIHDDAFLELTANYLARHAAWQVEQLLESGRPVSVWIDDPGAGHLGGAPQTSVDQERYARALGIVVRAIHDAGGSAGLHCCARPRFNLLRRVPFDVLSFDAANGLEGFFSEPDATALLDRGCTLALGLLHTSPDEDATPQAIAARWSEVAGDRASTAAERALVTTSCGLATTDPARLVEVFAATRAVGQELRDGV
ncbi:MAG: hypothetical protein CMJ83_01640 [Planctomycetes bacterium]|nr:hypothetical protein [Planctomycetota bacterium]